MIRESDVEKYLVKRVKALGGEVRKVKWIGRDGAPDRLVMLPVFRLEHIDSPMRKVPEVQAWLREVTDAIMEARTDFFGRTLWVELKRPGKLATFPADAHERKQDREHKRMRRMGQRVVVIDSFEGVDEVLA